MEIQLCLIYKENIVLITINNNNDNDILNIDYDSCWLICLTALAFV